MCLRVADIISLTTYRVLHDHSDQLELLPDKLVAQCIGTSEMCSKGYSNLSFGRTFVNGFARLSSVL
jgi:hypothetical protein